MKEYYGLTRYSLVWRHFGSNFVEKRESRYFKIKGDLPETSFFYKYPDAFECIATINALSENGWYVEQVERSDFDDLYICPNDKKLIAYVTSKGTVNHFEYEYMMFCYSKSLDKIVYFDNGKYSLTPDKYSEALSESIINEIRKIYN